MGPTLELRVIKQKKEFVLQKWSIKSEPEIIFGFGLCRCHETYFLKKL